MGAKQSKQRGATEHSAAAKTAAIAKEQMIELDEMSATDSLCEVIETPQNSTCYATPTCTLAIEAADSTRLTVEAMYIPAPFEQAMLKRANYGASSLDPRESGYTLQSALDEEDEQLMTAILAEF